MNNDGIAAGLHARAPELQTVTASVQAFVKDLRPRRRGEREREGRRRRGFHGISNLTGAKGKTTRLSLDFIEVRQWVMWKPSPQVREAEEDASKSGAGERI